jgi:hypothetical protein
MVGVIGSKKLAEQIQGEIAEFLRDQLKLNIRPGRAHIRHAKTEEVMFLGTRITFGGGEPKHTTTTRGEQTYKRRSTGWMPRMFAPTNQLVKRLHDKGFCTAEGKPTSNGKWTVLDDDQIVQQYNAVLRGMLNYYSFVDNYSTLGRVQYILQHSAAKTLAHKHKTKVRKIFQRYGNALAVSPPHDRSKKVSLALQTNWTSDPKRFLSAARKDGRQAEGVINFNIRLRTRSKLGRSCVICGSDDGVAMHHLKHVRRVGAKTDGFDRVKATINRKQISVCRTCHQRIHNGEYDGKKLSDFALSEDATS